MRTTMLILLTIATAWALVWYLTDLADTTVEAFTYALLAGWVVYYWRVARLVVHPGDAPPPTSPHASERAGGG